MQQTSLSPPLQLTTPRNTRLLAAARSLSVARFVFLPTLFNFGAHLDLHSLNPAGDEVTHKVEGNSITLKGLRDGLRAARPLPPDLLRLICFSAGPIHL
jgi:hypothetical protein